MSDAGRQGTIETKTMPTSYESPDLDSLATLDQRVQDDLSTLNYPPKNWIPPTKKPDGSDALDVVIIGGGMGGKVDKTVHRMNIK